MGIWVHIRAMIMVTCIHAGLCISVCAALCKSSQN